MAIFYGGQDIITTSVDTMTLLEELIPLGNIVHVQFEEEYAHMDFVWAKDANYRVYSTIVQLAKRWTAEKEQDMQERQKEKARKKKHKERKKKRKHKVDGKVQSRELVVGQD